MKKNLLAVCMLAILVMSCSCATIGKHNGADARAVLPSVVQVFNLEMGYMISPPEKPGADPQRSEVRPYPGTGTGVVVADDGEGSLVITAAHVVLSNPFQPQPNGVMFVMVKPNELSISTLEGKKCPATLVRADPKRDLALIKTACKAGLPVMRASSMPPIGAEVMIVGAPEGFHMPGSFHISEGRYLGEDPDKSRAFTSAGVSHGNSGSPVFYNGEVFGILVRMDGDFHHISILVTLDHLTEFAAGKTISE